MTWLSRTGRNKRAPHALISNQTSKQVHAAGMQSVKCAHTYAHIVEHVIDCAFLGFGRVCEGGVFGQRATPREDRPLMEMGLTSHLAVVLRDRPPKSRRVGCHASLSFHLVMPAAGGEAQLRKYGCFFLVAVGVPNTEVVSRRTSLPKCCQY